jgi:methyl-accepting chemotaxis protein
MLINLKNKNRLLLSFFAVGIIPFAIIGLISLNTARDGLSEQSFHSLKPGQAIKKVQIEDYFKRCRSDLRILANNHALSNLINYFKLSFDNTGAMNKETPEFTVKTNGKLLGQFIDEYEYYDLLIISKEGSVIWDCGNESDLGQNLLTGSLKNSLLEKSFSQGVENLTILDFYPYPSLNDQNSAFVFAPYYEYLVSGPTKEERNIFNMGY